MTELEKYRKFFERKYGYPNEIHALGRHNFTTTDTR